GVERTGAARRAETERLGAGSDGAYVVQDDAKRQEMSSTMTLAAPIGSRVAERFVLESVAGTGGMGTVYRARDEQTGSSVAIKLLQSSGNRDDAERFAREAEILSELHHPGIVTYLAHGETDDGQPYLAMEWLEGEDLAKRLSRG